MTVVSADDRAALFAYEVQPTRRVAAGFGLVHDI
jgi:hypothetical protein